jgi:hypothetical protein
MFSEDISDKKKAFEDMKIVLFGDDYDGNKREANT